MKNPLVSEMILPFVVAVGLLSGGILWFVDPVWANWLWFSFLLPLGGIVVIRTVRGLLAGRWAADIIASLAIITAIVMNEPLAGLIVVLMQTGGESLEKFATGRASLAVRQLEADSPQHAHIYRGDDIVDVRASDVLIGDILLVRPGELIPCDGVVTEGDASIDTSRITGEMIPVSVVPGDKILSGCINGSRPFKMQATAVASESQYARIVELVRAAQTEKAPFQRLADKYAIWFTPLTIVVAVLAALVSGDAQRVLAVLVVATPCPLILAPPIAFIGGINRAARRKIIMRNGASIERLARTNVVVFDKTGTLTIGRPVVNGVFPQPPFTRETLLYNAASVEQGSSHLLARSLVEAALLDGITIGSATDAVESAGLGISGKVDENHVVVGSRTFVYGKVKERGSEALEATSADGLIAYIAINGNFAGTITYSDELRAGVESVINDLKNLGFSPPILLTGDHQVNANKVAAAVGIVDVRSDLTPADKVTAVKELTARHNEVLMVGDGTNDAPALSAAAVGIALAGHGGGVTAEAADIVILIDELNRVPEAVRISRRTMKIAKQSMGIGLALSSIAMIVAAAGYITPVAGAVLQEVIDVAVILNALRASASHT